MNGVQTSPVNMEERKNLGIKAGDTVRVHQKIQDKGKTRIQVFEGVVLARKHGNEPGATFTVRKVSSGVGVEKIFPLYSPMIDKLEIVKRAKVRRAKLYYIREKVAREIKRQMRRMSLVSMSTESGAEVAAREAAEAEAKAAEEAKKAEEEAANKVNDEVREGDLGQAAEAEAVKVEETSEEAPVEEAKEETSSEDTEEASAPAEEVAEATPEADSTEETPAEEATEEKKD